MAFTLSTIGSLAIIQGIHFRAVQKGKLAGFYPQAGKDLSFFKAAATFDIVAPCFTRLFCQPRSSSHCPTLLVPVSQVPASTVMCFHKQHCEQTHLLHTQFSALTWTSVLHSLWSHPHCFSARPYHSGDVLENGVLSSSLLKTSLYSRACRLYRGLSSVLSFLFSKILLRYY